MANAFSDECNGCVTKGTFCNRFCNACSKPHAQTIVGGVYYCLKSSCQATRFVRSGYRPANLLIADIDAVAPPPTTIKVAGTKIHVKTVVKHTPRYRRLRAELDRRQATVKDAIALLESILGDESEDESSVASGAVSEPLPERSKTKKKSKKRKKKHVEPIPEEPIPQEPVASSSAPPPTGDKSDEPERKKRKN